MTPTNSAAKIVRISSRKPGSGSGWISKTARQAIYCRDGRACVFCGACEDDGAILTLDHVLACELGGDDSPRNLVTACLSCNSAKQDLTMRGWLAYLRAMGTDTTGVASRVRRQTAKALDLSAGKWWSRLVYAA